VRYASVVLSTNDMDATADGAYRNTAEADPAWVAASSSVLYAESDPLWISASGGVLYVESDPKGLHTDGSRAMSGELDMGGHSITNISTNSLVYADGTTVAAKFVDVAGDTMTGAIVLPSGGLAVGVTQLVVLANGYVGIGTANPTNALAVNGTIKAREIVVTLNGWADHVFEPGYVLMPLEDVDVYIKEHGHLPGIPNADQVGQGGLALGDFQVRMLTKIEELTLHIIELRNENAKLSDRLESFRNRPVSENDNPR
jgi:hypothetical protein